MKKKIITQIIENLNDTTFQKDEIDRKRQAEIAKIVWQIQSTGNWNCMYFHKVDPDLSTHIEAAPQANRLLMITAFGGDKVFNIFQKYRADFDFIKMKISFSTLDNLPDLQKSIQKMTGQPPLKNKIYLIYRIE